MPSDAGNICPVHASPEALISTANETPAQREVRDARDNRDRRDLRISRYRKNHKGKLRPVG
jgi:hypothetical protein